jgi:hypothetical protein
MMMDSSVCCVTAYNIFLLPIQISVWMTFAAWTDIFTVLQFILGVQASAEMLLLTLASAEAVVGTAAALYWWM